MPLSFFPTILVYADVSFSGDILSKKDERNLKDSLGLTLEVSKLYERDVAERSGGELQVNYFLFFTFGFVSDYVISSGLLS